MISIFLILYGNLVITMSYNRLFLLTNAWLGNGYCLPYWQAKVPCSVRTPLKKLGALLITLTAKTS